MNNKIKTLETLGQNSSIKQFESVQEMLLNQGIIVENISDLISANQPLICTWEPDEDDDKDKISF